MIADEILMQKFERIYLRVPEWISSAPGRVNLIGEHTDYNGGFVLPIAIDRGIKMAVAVREDSRVHLYSENYSDSHELDLSEPLKEAGTKTWPNYFIAVLHQFQLRDIPLLGMDVCIWGDIPVGSGLSSSAAYEVCVATLINHLTGTGMTRWELAQLAQAAEHSEFVGVNCGIMDQFISVFGESNNALMLDCYSMEYQMVPFDSSRATVMIINTMKKRGLVDSEYNRRRQECEEGLLGLRKLSREGYPTLRHVPLEVFERYGNQLPEKSRKRVKHILTENPRVLDFIQAMESLDIDQAGYFLYESHASLQEDYEVSCQELDFVVEIAHSCEGIYGCRMTGAGFGGCAVALVRPETLEKTSQTLQQQFHQKFALEPEIYITIPSKGVEIIPF